MACLPLSETMGVEDLIFKARFPLEAPDTDHEPTLEDTFPWIGI